MTNPTITQYPAQYAPPTRPYASGYPSVPTAQRRSVGPSAVVAGAGTALLVVSFTVLQWYRKDYGSVGGGGKKATFADIHHSLDKLQHMLTGNPFKGFFDLGFAPAYYSWLAWVLLAVAVSPLGSGLLRGAATLVGVIASGVTAWNIELFTFSAQLRGQMSNVPDGYWGWFKHTSFGAWAAIGGFLLLAVAAATGPRRR